MGVHAEALETLSPAPGLAMATTGECASLGRFSGVFSGQLANREELRAPVAAGAATGWSDGELLLALYAERGLEQLDLVAGSILAVIHDGPRLIAWCSPGAEQQLFVSSGRKHAIVATLPGGMFAGEIVPRELDFVSAAHAAAQLALPDGRSMFRHVRPLSPGEAVALQRGRDPVHLRRWVPIRRPRAFASVRDAGEELRATFALAVEDCLPSTPGKVASMLSGGRDSAAVVAMASLLLKQRGERLTAVTGAPALGVPAPPVAERISDEANLASAVAAGLSNVDHHVCRSEPGSFLLKLSAIHRGAVHPIGNLSNMPWYWAATEAARVQGCSVVLGGGAGNITISAGSRDYLRDITDPATLASTILRSNRLAPRAWLNTANMLLGPRLPRRFHYAILGATGRNRAEWRDLRTLSPEAREVADRSLQAAPQDYAASGFTWRLSALKALETSPVLLADIQRFEKRDPTRDRRVIDLMLSMPPDYLVPRPGAPRPVYAAAFGDMLPREVVLGKRRGYQGADWAAQFPVGQVVESFRSLLKHPLNQRLFDGDFIMKTVPERPSDPRAYVRDEVINLHRNMLLAALGTADWIAANFPDA